MCMLVPVYCPWLWKPWAAAQPADTPYETAPPAADAQRLQAVEVQSPLTTAFYECPDKLLSVLDATEYGVPGPVLPRITRVSTIRPGDIPARAPEHGTERGAARGAARGADGAAVGNQ